jgi:hypothetical protein
MPRAQERKSGTRCAGEGESDEAMKMPPSLAFPRFAGEGELVEAVL